MNPIDRYRSARLRLAGRTVLETPTSRAEGSELELQARIAAGEYGVSWTGEDGEIIEVVHFGAWNREPGPDFCRARIRIDGVERVGEIEIDPDVRDWDHHGHGTNPAYDNVILHLFCRRGARRFFTRTSDHRVVPQVCLQGAPRPRAAAAPPQAGLGVEAAAALIEAAARFRFHRKIERFSRARHLVGHDEALFQAVATGLGYRNNKIPFLLVAQRAGLARAAGEDGEALLFGLAGFLRADDFTRGDDEARSYLRGLWDAWWPLRDAEARLVLSADAWSFSSLRPANHPHRRLGALAAAARSIRPLVKADGAETFARRLGELRHPFWDRHFSLACDRLPRPAALIGPDRAQDLVINAYLPSLRAERGWEALQNLPGPAPSSRVRQAARWLCQAESGELLRRARDQQGLLQVYEDFFPRGTAEIWEAFAGPSARLED